MNSRPSMRVAVSLRREPRDDVGRRRLSSCRWRALTLFRARRLYAAATTRLARVILRLWGIRIRVHQERPFPRAQMVYISNHTSTLDLFVLVALGLPNTRFFLSGFLRKYIPLGILAQLMGTFFTVPQDRPAERVRIFQRADRILRKTRRIGLSQPGRRPHHDRRNRAVQQGRVSSRDKPGGADHADLSLRSTRHRSGYGFQRQSRLCPRLREAGDRDRPLAPEGSGTEHGSCPRHVRALARGDSTHEPRRTGRRSARSSNHGRGALTWFHLHRHSQARRLWTCCAFGPRCNRAMSRYTFLCDGEREADSITYDALDRLSRAIAARLRQRCRPGDRALLLYPPGLEFISAFFGCLYAQVVAVPAYPPNLSRSDRATSRLLAIAADARPVAVLSTRELMETLTGVSDAFSTSQPVDWIATNEVDDEESRQWRDPGVDGAALAFLQYTSGSTSTPKGVMISHRNLLHNLAYAFHLGGGLSSSISVSWLPVIHDMGLIEGVLQPAFSGCPAYLMSPAAFLQRPFRWLNAISRYGGTRSGGPNFAYDLCVRRISAEERQSLDLTTWHSAYCGAEPIRGDTLRSFASAFAPAGFSASALRPCFGLAEATLLVTAGTWAGDDAEVEQSRVSCGTPGFDTRVVIVEPETRRPCGPGGVGEIWVAGPSVAQGYWEQAEETAGTFRALTDRGEGPFLRTGDLGFMHDGDLYVSGRLKDVLIVRGMKHYPQDLEQTAEQHPAIRPGCSAAFATDAGSIGDRIAIVAEADVRQLTTPESADAAISTIRRSIAELHGVLLEAVVLVAPGAIPKTTSGKLQRFACRDAFLSDRLSALAAWRDTSAEGERCA